MALYINAKNETDRNAQNLKKESTTVSAQTIKELIANGSYSFYGSYAHNQGLNRNFRYEIFLDGSCIRVWSPRMRRFFTVAVKNK